MNDIKINYLRTWSTNIGNDFIDIGGITSFKKAIKNVYIYDFGGLGRRYFIEYGPNKYSNFYLKYIDFINRVKKILNKERKVNHKKFKYLFLKYRKSISNFFDISYFLDSDYVIVSGCILTYQIGLFYYVLKKMKEENIKIILYGVGGSTYSESEIIAVRKILKELEPYALISRDTKAYRNYNDLAEYSYNGIDAAFFISDSYNPPKLSLNDFLVLNFDKINEPVIDTYEKSIIRTTHYVSPLNNMPLNKIYKKNKLFLSNNAKDYFTIYSNAHEVHSDRVHACIATLIYGKPCRLYFNTKRSLLFDRIGINNINKKLVKLNKKNINKEKNKQINHLKKIIN
jgi:hypothetical protein